MPADTAQPGLTLVPTTKTDLPIAEHVVGLTTRQTAQILSCSERTVENLIAGKHLPVLRIGRSVRILSDELTAFMRTGTKEIKKATTEAAHAV